MTNLEHEKSGIMVTGDIFRVHTQGIGLPSGDQSCQSIAALCL